VKTATDALTILAQLVTFTALMMLALGIVARVLGVLMPWVLVLMAIAVDLQGTAECLLNRLWPIITCGAACAVLSWLVWVFWPRPTMGDGNRITLT
jgi:hypothetical protein